MLGPGWKHFNEGRYAEAERICRQVLATDADNADAWHLLGMANARVGRVGEAESCFRRAIAARPDFLGAHSNLGIALAIQGRPDEALTHFRQALVLNPHVADIHNNIGCALRDLGRLDEAVPYFHTAIRLDPDHAMAFGSLVHLLVGQKRYGELVDILRQLDRLRPDRLEIQLHLGDTLTKLERFGEAAACFRAALRLVPDLPEAYLSLGLAMAGLEDYDEATVHYQRSLELRPDQPADVHNSRGFALWMQGRYEEALACYERAIGLEPDHGYAHENRALAWLVQGDFARGWAEYEWRWKGSGGPMPGYPAPLWAGEPLDGRAILLHAEQGLGDTVQFIRYAPLVQARGGRVFVACQPALVRLLESCPGIERLIPGGGPLPPFDVHAPLMSLPFLLRTKLETIPASIPYLAADPALVRRWRESLGPIEGLRVGIAWQGNPKHRRDRRRSFPVERFEGIARVDGVRLISLQRGPGAEQLRALGGRFPVVDLGDEVDPGLTMMQDTPAVMMNLDLVITADTVLAHLAGALGIPVWIAVPFVPDFRWMLGREDSPWYPSARLFRQPRPGQWEDVFDRMARGVAAMASGHRRVAPIDAGISPEGGGDAR